MIYLSDTSSDCDSIARAPSGSVLGVLDVTQLGKVTSASNFRYFETYNVVALIYLTMTIGLSLALRRLERHLREKDNTG